jgi:hypothetical protein
MADEPIDIAKWFTDQSEPSGYTYERALVLGGTVSAACYTAGVSDFLLQVLDTWTAAKDRSDPQGAPLRAPSGSLPEQHSNGTSLVSLGAKAEVSDDRLAARNAG